MINVINIKHYHKIKTDDGKELTTEPVDICCFIEKENEEIYLPEHTHNINNGFTCSSDTAKICIDNGILNLESHTHLIIYKGIEYSSSQIFYDIKMEYCGGEVNES